ncbi:TetR/AcrR family transcriptional regulator [Nonomuraea sp. NPDC004580]|uniref:TetR/AcrR family transcriptional regulator n=1 Tax=Nonomuraea sp. NPDC004580 TaxID=3154552 RepID=UPI00339E5C79
MVEQEAGAVVGRRERKKQATRAALSAAALRLSLRHGVENVTVEQIAGEADIALRTFFNYFSSKEEAVVATLSAAAEQLIAEFRARPPEETVLAAFREAVLTVMDASDAGGRDHIRALRLVRTTPSLVPYELAVLAAQEQALAEAITERIAPPSSGAASCDAGLDEGEGVYPIVCAGAVLSALRVVLDRWSRQAGETGLAPDIAVLRRRFDAAIAELAAGLDRPGRAPAGPDPAPA